MNDTINSQNSGRLKLISNDQSKNHVLSSYPAFVLDHGRAVTVRVPITRAAGGSTRTRLNVPFSNQQPPFSLDIHELFKKKSIEASSSSSGSRNSPSCTFNASEFKQMHHKIPLRRYNSDDSAVEQVQINGGETSLQSSPECVRNTNRPEYELREFLERFSLPRVVKVSPDGRPLLLYKFLDDYVNYMATGLSSKKKKELQKTNQILYFPESYQGWFSLTNSEGNATAIAYTSLVQLVQEQVYTFLSTTPITGYIFNNEHSSGAYVKSAYESGEVFQLRGVFQHNPRAKTGYHIKGRDLENRYAQLYSINKNQELFVPLVTKGCYYEISKPSKLPLLKSKHSSSTAIEKKTMFIDKDCIYQLSHIVKICGLPVSVKLIAGQLPKVLGKNAADKFLLENKTTESVLFACVLPMNTNDNNYEITYFNYQSNLKLSRTLLGFDSEHRMLQSCRLQNAFTYCRINCDIFSTRAKTASEWNDFHQQLLLASHQYDRKNNFQLNSNEQLKIKSIADDNDVQQTNKIKWFKNFKSQQNNNNDSSQQLKSMDRYKDMSKLIDEKFGKKQSNPVKKSASFMFASRRDCLINSSQIQSENKMNLELNQHPDLIPYCRGNDKYISNSLDSVYNEKQLIYSSKSLSQDKIILNQSKNSYITDRLCSKFHVKTKNLKTKRESLAPVLQQTRKQSRYISMPSSSSTKPNLPLPPRPHISQSLSEDLPYISAVDALDLTRTNSEQAFNENIYVEICEKTDNFKGALLLNNDSNEHSYVHLNSNADNQIDEPIYSTLK